MLKKRIVLASLLLSTVKLMAQDYHLSQYDVAVQYLNPALTGMLLDKGNEDVNFRMNANYRSQWGKLNGTPYSTMNIGFDMPFGRFGTGLYIHSNRSGANNLNTFNILFSASYQISNKPDIHSISTGLQFGVLNKSFNSGSFLFDSQYSSSTGMDASLPNGENFEKGSLWKPDINWGTHYKLMDKTKKYHPFIGFSVYHVNRPNESFYNKSKLPMRFTVHAGSDFEVDDKWTVTPTVLFLSQAKATELNLGLMGSYNLDNSDFTPLAGISWRRKDAIAFHLGLKQRSNQFRISYDWNTSALKTYTKGRGAIEFGVIFMGKQDKIVPPRAFF